MHLPDDGHLTLHHHAATPGAALVAAEVRVRAAAGGGLALCYRLFGDTLRLIVPDPRPVARVDGLWHHTCCEAFVAAAGSPAYREFNLSPSGQWAVYDFSGYRLPAPSLPGPQSGPVPSIHRRSAPDALEFDVVLPAAWLPEAADTLELGLCMVVEERTARAAGDEDLPTHSYWALRHTGERPDFHRRDSFALSLPADFARTRA